MNRKEMLDKICEVSDEVCNTAVALATKKEMERAIDNGYFSRKQADKFMAYINAASSMVIRDSYEQFTTLELEKINGWLSDPLYIKMVKGMTSRGPGQIRAYKEYIQMFCNSEEDYVVKELLRQAEGSL